MYYNTRKIVERFGTRPFLSTILSKCFKNLIKIEKKERNGRVPNLSKKLRTKSTNKPYNVVRCKIISFYRSNAKGGLKRTYNGRKYIK